MWSKEGVEWGTSGGGRRPPPWPPIDRLHRTSQTESPAGGLLLQHDRRLREALPSKKFCNIERNLTVEWEEDEKEIVLTSLLLLSKSTIDKLKICVDSVIHGRSLSSLDFDVSTPRSTSKIGNKKKTSRETKKKKLITLSLAEGFYKK